MDAVALGLMTVWILLAFVVRSVIQYRTTGDSGIRRGMLTAPIGSAESIAGWAFVVALVSAFAAPALALGGVGPVWHSPGLERVGLVVALIGVVATFLAQVDMGRAWRIGVDPEERTELVTDGAFALARNPIFTAMLVTGGGFALMVANWVALLGFGLLVLAIELQVRLVEEPHLRRSHGEAYAAYERQVGRFVPGLGRR